MCNGGHLQVRPCWHIHSDRKDITSRGRVLVISSLFAILADEQSRSRGGGALRSLTGQWERLGTGSGRRWYRAGSIQLTDSLASRIASISCSPARSSRRVFIAESGTAFVTVTRRAFGCHLASRRRRWRRRRVGAEVVHA